MSIAVGAVQKRRPISPTRIALGLLAVFVVSLLPPVAAPIAIACSNTFKLDTLVCAPWIATGYGTPFVMMAKYLENQPTTPPAGVHGSVEFLGEEFPLEEPPAFAEALRTYGLTRQTSPALHERLSRDGFTDLKALRKVLEKNGYKLTLNSDGYTIDVFMGKFYKNGSKSYWWPDRDTPINTLAWSSSGKKIVVNAAPDEINYWVELQFVDK